MKYIANEKRYEQSDTLYQRCGRSGVLLPKVSLGLWHNFGGVDVYERSRDILISKEKPKQADFRTDTISFDSLTTLRPVIQHFDSIMQGKIPAKKRKK